MAETRKPAVRHARPELPDGTHVLYLRPGDDWPEEYVTRACGCSFCDAHRWWVLDKRIPDRGGRSALDTGAVSLLHIRSPWHLPGLDADHVHVPVASVTVLPAGHDCDQR